MQHRSHCTSSFSQVLGARHESFVVDKSMLNACASIVCKDATVHNRSIAGADVNEDRVRPARECRLQRADEQQGVRFTTQDQASANHRADLVFSFLFAGQRMMRVRLRSRMTRWVQAREAAGPSVHGQQRRESRLQPSPADDK
jgi:hypothetical protein